MKRVILILIEDKYLAYKEFKVLTNRIKELEERLSINESDLHNLI